MINPGYDLSKLKANGSHYVGITFSAPYCLHLPELNYEVALAPEDKPHLVQVILQRRYRNASQRSLLPGVEQIEKIADRRGEYCYTHFTVYIPVRGADAATHSDYSKMSKAVEANHSSFRQQALKASNRLIGIYRLGTGECHVKPLTGHDAWADYDFVFFFNELSPTAGRSKFRGDIRPIYDIHNIVPLQANIPETVVAEIQKQLASDFQVRLSDELLLNAHDFLDQGNHRLAVIEAETSFEAALFDFLRDHFGARVKIKNYQSPVALIEDSPFQAAMTSKGKEFNTGLPRYEEWLNQVWEIRNKLVHGKLPTVTYETAEKAVQIIESNLEYLLERPQTYPWRFN